MQNFAPPTASSAATWSDVQASCPHRLLVLHSSRAASSSQQDFQQLAACHPAAIFVALLGSSDSFGETKILLGGRLLFASTGERQLLDASCFLEEFVLPPPPPPPTASATSLLCMRGSPAFPLDEASAAAVARLAALQIAFTTHDYGDANPASTPSLWLAGTSLDLQADDLAASWTSALHSHLQRLTAAARLVIFMKGDCSKPQCKFSARLAQALRDQPSLTAPPHGSLLTVDVLADEVVRQGMKKFSDWPTYPQVYWRGDFIGGLDCFLEQASSLA